LVAAFEIWHSRGAPAIQEHVNVPVNQPRRQEQAASVQASRSRSGLIADRRDPPVDDGDKLAVPRRPGRGIHYTDIADFERNRVFDRPW
jgi:hypothetical protein